MGNFNDCIRRMIGILCVFTIIVIFISSCKNNTSDLLSKDRAKIENASKNVMSIIYQLGLLIVDNSFIDQFSFIHRNQI